MKDKKVGIKPGESINSDQEDDDDTEVWFRTLKYFSDPVFLLISQLRRK